ncbi:hypothetical protein CsSME_00016423 [Camellia sinensis var. sinensis]
MVDGCNGDSYGEGRRIVEGRDGEGRRMAEGGDDGHGEGQRITEEGDGTARRYRDDDEGDGFCTPEGQSEPHVAMDNICSQGGSFSASQGQSQPSLSLGNHSIQGVYTAQGQSRPPFAMGSNYVEGHGRAIYISQCQSQSRPESQSQPPFAMGHTSVHDVVYPTYDELLRGTSVQLLQASHSPANSHVDRHPWKACTER